MIQDEVGLTFGRPPHQSRKSEEIISMVNKPDITVMVKQKHNAEFKRGSEAL